MTSVCVTFAVLQKLELRCLRLAGERSDFVRLPFLCGVRNRRLPLQTDGWRTTLVVAPHNRGIYKIGFM